jgi:hypothetical protein
MVRSWALLFLWKKNTFFWKCFPPYYRCFEFKKNVEKSCDARFFGAKTVLRIFLGFSEKSRKKRKKCVFFEKKLMVSGPFSLNVALPFNIRKSIFLVRKKSVKKKGFHFLKLFFKNENWTFIFVHFWI